MYCGMNGTLALVRDSLYWELPRAVITHLLTALGALLFAAINYIHAWRIFKMPS